MTPEKIISEFKQELFGFVRKRIADEDKAKDVHQEILIKIFTRHHTLKNQDRLKSWIYQIARNSIIDYFRRSKIHVPVVKESASNDVLSETEEDELLPCIKPFLEKLKPSYKEALEFIDLGNNTQKQLAEKLDMSYSGAKSTVQRARLQLRNLFNQCCKIEADKYGSILSVTHHTDCSCP